MNNTTKKYIYVFELPNEQITDILAKADALFDKEGEPIDKEQAHENIINSKISDLDILGITA